jgi:ADP-ribose pyrophosphatase
VGGPLPWDVLGVEILQDCKVFRVNRTLVRSPSSGETHPFHTIEAAPWVNVVPITRDGQLVMVRQYRHGSREVTLEIPGGIVDPGEEPAAAAARELIEETGYRAERVRPLGSLNPNPALFANRVHTFLAEDVERVTDVMNGPLEETVVELVPAAEVSERVLRGEIDHALVVAALHRWSLARERGS